MTGLLPLITTVFVSSLIGSLHCAGMCGAFVAFAVGGPGAVGVSRRQLQAAYHGGRLVAYVVLGTLAGALGAALDLGGQMVGVQRGATLLAGTVMVLAGVAALLQLAGLRLGRVPVPAVLQRTVAAGHRATTSLAPTRRALVTGLLTGLLPCGWLWAFLATAAGTASPAWGAATMAVFWLGTVPLLAAVGVGVQALAGRFARFVPALTSAALVLVGLYTLGVRAAATPALAAGPVAGSPEQLVARSAALSATTMPCCHH